MNQRQTRFDEPFQAECSLCKQEYTANTFLQMHCPTCRELWGKLSSSAVAQVTKAKKNGELPLPNTLNCIDCGKQAYGYDHRDYEKPLDVVPICRSCNWHRGPAKNYSSKRLYKRLLKMFPKVSRQAVSQLVRKESF